MRGIGKREWLINEGYPNTRSATIFTPGIIFIVGKSCLSQVLFRTNAAGFIEYKVHPFWVQKYCLFHECHGTPRCCSCERMEALIANVRQTFQSVSSHVYDLETGEDNWRVNDYLHRLDSCIEVAIQKQKEQLSVEQLEAKLGPLCSHDFALILVPLLKSYLRAHIENLAEKDATEKSDAAREAFLAELAQDSKKRATYVSKHLNKRKNKEYRKVKDSTATSNCESESVDEDSSVDIIKQEDEAMRRKIELEAEERKLKETLEYERRIEDEAKQKHLAKQIKKKFKNASRKTRTEDDDEKRFQADLSKAVRQSLDAFHSHYEGEEESCVTSIESLWHLRRFREEFLNTSTSAHVYVGDQCVTCALHDTFKALNMASTDSKSQPVAPTSLRIALSNLYPHNSFFSRGGTRVVYIGARNMGPVYYILVALPCTLGEIGLVLLHIYRHLLNYTEPTYQRYIVRIIFMVPIAIGTNDVYKTAEAVKPFGGNITREPGALPSITTKITACLDPDGWKTLFVDNIDFLKEEE
ncbi:hypothetical protein L2E82_41555 [Cichorium intybus]|uniref:Uncharacterized protein n=1 Tax=Cichorium intybus TaxID=13427 RepID=A0ACB9APZ4_CICIN|nr:hypothetical protein L2E82_41555 [Cichorium intybus]